MNKVLSLLGLAKKAGKLVCGTDAVCDNLKNHSFQMIFVAKDASSSTIKKIENKGTFYNIPVNKSFSSEEITTAIGCSSIVIGLIDPGFAEAIKVWLEKVESENN